jgi:outer membrane biogenesis lipoprotein LolB
VRIIVACIAALTLAGCAEYEARQQERANAQAAAMNANDDAQCQSYGAAPGSPAYIQCRMNLDNQRAAMRQMIAGQIVGNMLSHQ